MTHGIHRFVENHAATFGEAVSIVDGDRSCTYRELNYAANALARRLISNGFRRGAHARIRMKRSVELAVTLLGVLKAGGSYTVENIDLADAATSEGVSFRLATQASEDKHLHLDAAALVDLNVGCSPNLPVLTRATDVACVLEGTDGQPSLVVPHATIAAMRSPQTPRHALWTGESGAFDLWAALLGGAAAIVAERAAAFAA